MRLGWIICVFGLIISDGAQAQRARMFTTDNELANSLILDIHKDRYGLVWIATESGINQYDGARFKVFSKKRDSLLSNSVHLIFEDKRGNLFFGFHNGLQVYKRAEGTFETIPLILESGSVSSAHVLTMVETKDGRILVGTSGHGIFEIKKTLGKTKGFQDSSLVPSFLIFKLYEDSKNNLWIATQDKGLYKKSPVSGLSQYCDFKTEVGIDVSDFSEDLDGNLFIGTFNHGLYKYDFEKEKLNSVADKLHTSIIQDIELSLEGMLLIGTDGNGLKQFDPATNQITNLNFSISNFDFTKSKIHVVKADNDGNYWLGLFQKGVAVIPSKLNGFKYIGYQSSEYNSIGTNYIVSLYKDNQGILWAGTDSDGIYKINYFENNITHIQNTQDNNLPLTAMCIAEDGNRNIWVGSYLEGLLKYDREKNQLTKTNLLLNKQGNTVNSIFDLIVDEVGNLWIATMGNGIYYYDQQSQVVMNFDNAANPFQPNDAFSSLHNSWVNSLCLTKDKVLLIGTMDGLSGFDLIRREFIDLNTRYPQFRGQIINDIHEDEDENIWVGTASGLVKIDNNTDSLFIYNTLNGLPNDIVCAIESDIENNIWVSTNYGMAKLSKDQQEFLSYFYNDGIQGNEFGKRTSFYDNETLFFGGINGITFFRPKEIEEVKDTVDIGISGFFIDNQEVYKGLKSGKYQITNSFLMNTDTFHLAHFDNSFEISLTSFEYLNPERIKYLYSMNDEEWEEMPQGQHMLALNNLEPGTYGIKIKAKDLSSYSKEKTITVIIHRPWYQRIWAIMLFVSVSLMIIGIIGYLIRQRYLARKEMREHLHLEQINEAKLEFFTNIAHEIKTPLTLILNPLNKLDQTDQDTVRKRTYAIIRRNTERLLHLVNQLMDLRKIDRGKFALAFQPSSIIDLIYEAQDLFEESINSKHIDFKVRHTDDLSDVWLDPRYFDKVIQNILSNALKFTPDGGSIAFDVYKKEKNLVIECRDTGPGINEQDIHKIFNRFYQGKAENQNVSVGNGIGLHLTKSIIELHAGSISVYNNNEGPGCTFTIKIPIGKDHIKEEELLEVSTKPKITTVDISLANWVESFELELKKPRHKQKILVVDDDGEMKRFITQELSGDYQIFACDNAKEAYNNTLLNEFDLVISDVVMPEMDGITLCKKMKQNININHIPVILLTALSEENNQLEALGVGADAYITKPFNIEVLKKTAESLLKNRHLLKNNFTGNQQMIGDQLEDVELISADQEFIEKITKYIDSNMNNPDLNVELMAREIGMSRVHLHRKLKELTNQSAGHFIKNIRLQKAGKLLSSKKVNIADVAYAIGFSNPSKFSASFKAFYGMSPKQYMEIYGKH